MPASAVLSNSILIITSAILFWVALTDFKEFKIRNELILVLVGLYILHSVTSGRWVEMHWHLGIAAVTLAISLYAYSLHQMGGGDVKLLVVAFLWTGPSCGLILAVLLLVFISMHTLAAKLGWAAVQRSEQGSRIPLAPSLGAALIGTFASGCMHQLR
jgi:prepilin peptidase CpaA